MRGAPAWASGFLGLALVLGGVVVFALANGALGGPADFGWTTYSGSYAPLEARPPGAYESALFLSDGWSVFWTGWHLLGAALAVLGLLVLAGLGGWLLGLRSGRQAG
jgi:hypothetical protein